MAGQVTEAGGLKMPNFDSLGGWFEKMRDWCQGALSKIAELEEENSGLDERLSQTADDSETLRELMSDLHDLFEHGVKSPDEVWEKWRPRWQ
jgi:predicted nuclease with TOPRIM domain